MFAQQIRLGCNILSKYCQILPSTFCMYLIVTNNERLSDNLLEPKEKSENVCELVVSCLYTFFLHTISCSALKHLDQMEYEFCR